MVVVMRDSKTRPLTELLAAFSRGQNYGLSCERYGWSNDLLEPLLRKPKVLKTILGRTNNETLQVNHVS